MVIFSSRILARATVDGDLLRQIAVGDGRRGPLGDVAHLARLRFDAMKLTEVGQILPRAGRRRGTSACPPSLPSVPTFARPRRVTSDANEAQLIDPSC